MSVKTEQTVEELDEQLDEALKQIDDIAAIVAEGNIGKEHIGFCNNDNEFIEAFKANFKQRIFS